MTWAAFNYLGPAAALAWLAASFLAWRGGRTGPAGWAQAAGLLLLAIFLGGYWLSLGRPPFSTLGETHLWYSFFLAAAGLLTYQRRGHSWLLISADFPAAVFVLINWLNPETQTSALTPALRSPYFVPHVTLYLLAYAFLAVATAAAGAQLAGLRRGEPEAQLVRLTDRMVETGFGLLMLGLLSGAAWAQEAWGHYWSWDPKETWAFATAAAYLLYIHLRRRPVKPWLPLAILILAFSLLMITWLGAARLPSAAGSLHSYSSK